MKLFIVTGEPSGDALAAGAVQVLRQRLRERGEELVLSGVGGERLAEEGLTSLFPQSDIAVMGISAVAGRLPTILARLRQTTEAAVAEAPDLLLTVDSPDFSLRVAKRVRKRAPDIPIVHWVCPSVWAWRPGDRKSVV